MADEQPDTRGPAIVIHGTLERGFKKAYGPFSTMKEASEWAVHRSPVLGWVTIYLLDAPESCNVLASAP